VVLKGRAVAPASLLVLTRPLTSIRGHYKHVIAHQKGMYRELRPPASSLRAWCIRGNVEASAIGVFSSHLAALILVQPNNIFIAAGVGREIRLYAQPTPIVLFVVVQRFAVQASPLGFRQGLPLLQ
jgi:hypothetical protein